MVLLKIKYDSFFFLYRGDYNGSHTIKFITTELDFGFEQLQLMTKQLHHSIFLFSLSISTGTSCHTSGHWRFLLRHCKRINHLLASNLFQSKATLPPPPRIILLTHIKVTVVVQLLSCVRLFVTSLTVAHHAPLSLTISQTLLKFMPIELVMLFNHLILCLIPFLTLPSIFLSIRIFPNESAFCFKWPKYRSFYISPSSEYSGLIFFRIDQFDLHAVQGTLKSLLQHHNAKLSIFWCSAFFMVQLSEPYMTTGKTIALTRWTFVGKAFLPSKHLSVSWLQSLFAVILEPKKIKPVTVTTFSPSTCHEVVGSDAMILSFLNAEL